MKAADAIANILRCEGVEWLIGYPVNHVIEGAAKAGIRPIIVRQERTGLHMADAISRITSGEKLGVFCMQSGPGTENSFGGIAQAWSESVPLLALPGGYSRRQAWVERNFNASVQMRGIVKSAEPIMSARDIPAIFRRAFQRLRSGRGGPVLVEIPSDVWNDDIEPFDYAPPRRLRSGPDPESVREAVRLLAAAKRPTIYAGQGVHWARAWPELQEFAELLGSPVCTSLEGKSAFPETHPLAMGSAGMAMPASVHHFLREADLIFGVGCSFTETAFGVAMPAGKTIIHATLDPMDVNKDVGCALALLGDAKLVLQSLIEQIRRQHGSASRDPSATARAMGGYGERVEAPRDIIPAIRRGVAATERGQPALLEFITCKETAISRF